MVCHFISTSLGNIFKHMIPPLMCFAAYRSGEPLTETLSWILLYMFTDFIVLFKFSSSLYNIKQHFGKSTLNIKCIVQIWCWCLNFKARHIMGLTFMSSDSKSFQFLRLDYYKISYHSYFEGREWKIEINQKSNSIFPALPWQCLAVTFQNIIHTYFTVNRRILKWC